MALYEYRKACVATYKRVWQQAFEMLEPTALKGARWVLRREGGGNASFLSDYEQVLNSPERFRRKNRGG